jgi:phosphatidate cytidylyltransferase
VDPRRVYSALVFFPLFYLLVRYLPPVAFTIFVATGILLAQYEYYRLHFPQRFSTPMGLGLLCGLLITTGFAAPSRLPEPATITLIIMAILLSHALSGRDLKTGLLDTAVVAFGAFYVAWLLGHLILIDRLANGPFLIFFLFLVTWANDTAAYYVGTLLGRHPLAPAISPRKTWEGAIGGLLGSVAAAFACRAWFMGSLSVNETAWLGLMIGLAAPLGDLCESALKRSASVKDSGRIIPGHGGMLDRVDSLIFTTPVFYYCLLAMRSF